MEKSHASFEEEKKRYALLEEDLATANEFVTNARDQRDLVVKQLEKANADSAAQLSALQKELQDAEQSRDATVAKLTAQLNANSASAAQEISALQSKLEKNMDLLSDLTLQMSAKEEELRRANLAQGEALSAQIKKLQLQLDEATQSRGSEVQDLMSKLKDANVEIEKKNALVRDQEEKAEKLSVQLQESHVAFEAMKNRYEELKERLSDAQKANKELPKKKQKEKNVNLLIFQTGGCDTSGNFGSARSCC